MVWLKSHVGKSKRDVEAVVNRILMIVKPFQSCRIQSGDVMDKMTDMTDLKVDFLKSYHHMDIMTDMTKMTDKS